MLHALGLLCGLSAVAFAALATRRAGAAAYVLAFATAAAALSPARFPEPETVAIVAAAVAGAVLWRQRWSLLAAVGGGFMAAAWGTLLEAQGLPALPSHAMAAGLGFVAAALAWRSDRFAPARLVEEALLLVTAFAVLMAAAPTVLDGLRAARALKAVPLATDRIDAAPWALSAAAACLLLGGLYSLWRRR